MKVRLGEKTQLRKWGERANEKERQIEILLKICRFLEKKGEEQSLNKIRFVFFSLSIAHG